MKGEGTKMIKNYELTSKCKLRQYQAIGNIWFPYSLAKPDIVIPRPRQFSTDYGVIILTSNTIGSNLEC